MNVKDSNRERMIKNLLERGVENIYPSKEFLQDKLKQKKPLKIYLGIDPTGPTLHLGHSIQLKKLKEFQDLGHKTILLIGDFTALIGDPTGKSQTRTELTKQEVLKNLKSYKKQASHLLKFAGKNKTEIKFNSRWLSKMKFEDVLRLASKMTVEQMLKRDMFEKRMDEGKPIFIHEFLYPLMQGYDSVAMDIDGEIGGNDQTFNMLVGRNLMKQLKEKEKFVLTTKLLVDNAGKKMGKTEGNMVTLKDSPEEMFGKIMSWSDSLIIPAFELCTNIPTEKIQEIEKEMSGGANPRDYKTKLASEIVRIYHGDQKSRKAEERFISTFKKGEIPNEIEKLLFREGEKLSQVLVEAGILKSKSEFHRLLRDGAIHNLTSGENITDPNFMPADNLILRIGKKRFVKLKKK